MTERPAIVTCEPLRGLRLEGRRQWRRKPYDKPDVRLTLSISGLEAVAQFPWFHVAWAEVANFFREIDRNWRGWHGSRDLGSPDDPFHLSASHDGLGHVRVWISFADHWSRNDAQFRVGAALALDVGSAIVVASVIDDWIAEIWGAEPRESPT